MLLHPVENDETGIYGLIQTFARKDSTSVATKPAIGFEQHNAVLVGQQMGGGHTRNSPPDHSDVAGGRGGCLDRHQESFRL
jgi:hypothetical protein